MQFTLCNALLALFALSAATPITANDQALQVASPVERGLVWTPRSLDTRQDRNRGGRDQDRNRNNNNNNRRIIIAQPINIRLTQIQIIKEVQIINVIQNLIVVNGLERARDTIRRNHFRNRNRGRNVNTVVIIVTVVVDARDRGRQNVRYLTRQVESDPRAQTKEWLVVTESSTVTVDGQQEATASLAPTAVTPAPAFSTGESQAQLGLYDPNQQLQESDDALLPEGIGAPDFESKGARRAEDPAKILEEDQVAFVVFEGDIGR